MLFCKQQVVGSSPMVGSTENPVIATKSGPLAIVLAAPISAFTPIHTPNRFTTSLPAATRTYLRTWVTAHRRARGDENHVP